MMAHCMECGKEFDILWPHLWKYKRKGQWLCSYGCMRSYDRKEAEDMETKKDGTQRKKPGRKPAATATVEAKKIEIAQEAPKFEYKTNGIETAIGDFRYFKNSQYLDWSGMNGETVSMNLEEWREFMKVFPEALKVLGVKL